MRNGLGIVPHRTVLSFSREDHRAFCQDICHTEVESYLHGLCRDVQNHQNAMAKLFYNLMRREGFQSKPSLKGAIVL